MDIVTDLESLRIPCRLAVADDELVGAARLMAQKLKADRVDGLKALGIAANQLGYTFQMIVILDATRHPLILINPEIKNRCGSILLEEFCLSLPGQSVPIYRSKLITVKFLNQYLVPRKLKFSGLLARVVCHGIDHLRGKLITDYGPSITSFSGQEDDGEL